MSILNQGLEMKFVKKGWGYEKWIVNKPEYCGKLLYFMRDKRCSWHYHKLKDEHFYINKGSVKILYGDHKNINLATSETLKQGDVFHVPVGLIHRLIALEDTEVFEFSTQHFDEDSIRVEKGD